MSFRISVALPLPIDRTFSYLCPSELKERARPGCRAVVPLGRRILTGVIVDGPGEDVPEAALREVLDLPDREPLLADDILDLTRWISQYYFCSWGEAIKAALPTGHLQAGLRIARAVEEFRLTSASLTRAERKVLKILHRQGACSPAQLARQHGIHSVLKPLQRLQELGLVELKEILPRGVPLVWQELISAAENFSSADLHRKASEYEPRAPRQAQILRLVAQRPGGWIAGDLLRQANAPRFSLASLISAGILMSERVQIKRYPTLEALTLSDEEPLPNPNEDQTKAIATITESLEKGKSRTLLLYGVTGSGKTLVYQKVIERVLSTGGTTLVLIPEISLTPQTVSRFRAVFGDRIGLQHSAMSAGERTDVWQGIKAGEFPIVIGARSAVFAPLKNLKLIIVDEEGDPSFKQNEPNPRYNARDVALVRARQCGAVAVLGSATPSVESFYNAQRGRFTLLELPSRVDGVPPPAIRFTSPPRIRHKVLGPELERAILGRFQQGEQIILLHNRRGFFTFVFCSHCDYICRCRRCEITLTFHRVGQALRCHICGYQTTPPRSCPECGKALRYAGVGTQRVEDELAGLMPPEKIVRLDLDTTGRKGSHHRILKNFARQDHLVLLGTKMVARGHDYPLVTLVGVISADAELAFPDFRCDERAFVLLLQAAGRAGRRAGDDRPGEVLIQTWLPDHPILELVRQGDYRTFYQREIELRRSLNYPPWGWMILFGFSSLDQEKARRAAEDFVRNIRERIRPGELMGPTPAFRSRLKNRYRYQVILKTSPRHRSGQSPLHLKLRQAVDDYKAGLPSRVQMTVDVDPIQLL